MPVPKPHAIAATLALLVLMAALFAPALFQGKILAPLDITTTMLPPWGDPSSGAKPHNHYPTDAVTQYLPYRIFAEESLREDGYIGWNPYEMGGYNLAANTMALPGSWPMQLHRWLPFKDAWNLGILAEFLTAGLGMLAFLRSRKLPWLPCMVGSVAFMLNAQFTIWVYHRWALGSFCWLPWVLWSCSGGLSSRPLPARTFLLPAFIALALLGGSLQHMAFVVLACICMAAASIDLGKPAGILRPLATWAVAGVLAVGMAAFSIIPQIEGYLANVSIGHIRGGLGYHGGALQPLLHLLFIPARIWPWLAGDPQTLDAWKLLQADYMSLNFIGTIPMILGFAGLFIRRMPAAAKCLICTGLAIPLTPLVGPLYHRVELLFILGAAWMSAEMIARLPVLDLPIHWRKSVLACVILIGAVLALAAITPAHIRKGVEQKLVTKAVEQSRGSQLAADEEWIASRTREWSRRFSLTHPRTAWVFALLATGASGLLLASSSNRARMRSGQLMIAGATFCELATLFTGWTTFSNPGDLTPGHPAIESVRGLADGRRVLQSVSDGDFATTFATPNLLAAFRIPSVEAYESIQYRSQMVALRDQPAEMKLALAGVGLAVTPASLPPPPGTDGWMNHGVIGGHRILESDTVPPFIAAGSGAPPSSPPEILLALPDSRTIHPALETPNRMEFRIPENTRWIRIARNWHPGWKWRTRSGDWQPFRDGPDASCWIDHLPVDSRVIEVRFFPRPAAASALSVASLLLVLALPLGVIRRRPAQA